MTSIGIIIHRTFIKHDTIFGSELLRNDAVMEFSDSVMTFNTNYKDTGLFGVYAIAKVLTTLFSPCITFYRYFQKGLFLHHHSTQT